MHVDITLAEELDRSRGYITHVFGAFWIPGDPINIHPNPYATISKECEDLWNSL